jgi:hypothetical protein
MVNRCRSKSIREGPKDDGKVLLPLFWPVNVLSAHLTADGRLSGSFGKSEGFGAQSASTV